MILIISAMRDSHARVVAHEIARRGAEVAIADVTEFGAGATLNLNPERPRDATWVRADGSTIALGDVRSVWCRRVFPPTFDPAVRKLGDRSFMQRQWTEMLWGTIMALDAELLSDPFKQKAATKPYQLAVARRVGLTIPATRITNDPQRAREFVSRHERRVVNKSLAISWDQFLYTKLWDDTDDAALHELTLAPMILQRQVTGSVELRVTVIGDQCFAAEFVPSGHVDGRLDSTAAYRAHRLPAEIERRLGAMMSILGLRYATIDLRLDSEGDYVFLDLNPQGQYLYVEIRTGQPMTRALVDLLVGADEVRHREAVEAVA
jgi:hypothetical protein